MIQCLFLPNDCNDGSERLQPAVGSLSRVLEGEGFFYAVWSDWEERRAELELMSRVMCGQDTILSKMIPYSAGQI